MGDGAVQEYLIVIIYAPPDRSNTRRRIRSIDAHEGALDVHEAMHGRDGVDVFGADAAAL